MSLSATSDGAVLSSPRIRLDGGFHVTETAATGVVGISDVLLDDETGDLDVVGLRPIFLDESAASPQRIFTGSHWDRDISRGPYRAGPSRQYACRVRDQNERLVRRIIRSADGKRPAETDLARLTWLLGHASMTGLVADLGLANATDNPINLDESDYRHRYPMDVFADMCPIAGKTSFVYYDESSDSFGLFYDKPGATGHDSTLRLSNDMADYDGTTTFYPSVDAVMTRTPEDLYSGIDYGYLGDAYVFRRSSTTVSTYEERDFTYSTTRVGRLATATANADQFLSDHGAESDQIAVSVTLPNTAVNGIRAGMRLSVKFTHIPGFEPFTWTRVVQRDIRQLEGDATQYVLSLLLSTSVFVGITGEGGGDFPHPPAVAPGFVQHVYGIDHLSTTVTLPNPPGEGNLLVCWQTTRGNTTLTLDPVGWTVHPDGLVTSASGINADQGRMMWRIAGAGESATVTVRNPIDSGGVVSTSLAEFTGIGLPRDTTASHAVATSTLPATVNAGTLTPTAGKSVLLVVGLCAGVSDYPSDVRSFFTPGAGWTELDDKMTDFDLDGSLKYHPLHWFGYQFVNPTSGSYSTAQTLGGGTLNYRGDAGESVAFLSAAQANPPTPGQWVYNELVTLTAGVGTTAFPFADGSLHVRYDIIDQTPAIVSYDGSTGEFTMPSQPPLGTQVFVDYQGR